MLAVLFYGLSTIYSIFLWRRGFREDNRVNYGLLLIAAVFHTVAMVKRGFTLQRCPVSNLYEAITFIAWTISISYLAVGSWSRLRFLGAFASPVLFAMGVFALFPELDRHGAKAEFTTGWQSLHAALILLAYGSFGLGSVAGVMYLTQEHDLKFHKLRAVFSLMPPIERLEKVIGRLMAAGFFLLTVGLVLGAYSLKQKNGMFFTGDMKIVWSMFVWAVYLGLLVMRWRFSQGGRRFAWGAVASFAFILLTFWGTNLASRIHHQ
jgi:ABC-type transport system involved in cytochrome c biogenesis permease subunit